MRNRGSRMSPARVLPGAALCSRPAMRRFLPLAAMALLLAGCLGAPATPSAPPPDATDAPTAVPATGPLRYVALGDSYVIGDELPRQVDRWPNQLVRALRPGVSLDLVDNLAGPGHGTFEVLDLQMPVLAELDPGIVSLQVGVNDIVISRLTDEEYRENLVAILDGSTAASAATGLGILDLVPPDRVFLVTTPDFTRAPDPRYDRPDVADTIARFNDILREVAAARGVEVVDIAPISDIVDRDPTLVGDDGLHPSAKQYAGWVELIATVVRRLVAGG